MLGDTVEAQSTESILPDEEVSEPHLHPLETVKIDSKLKEIFHLEFITTAAILHNSLK